MYDVRPTNQKSADTAAAKGFIDQLGISEKSQDGVVAAFRSMDSSYTILVGVGTSQLDGGAKHLVIERHGNVARSTVPGTSNWRMQFRFTGEHFSTSDPTFLGFATFGTSAVKDIIDEISSGRNLTRISVDGLEFFKGRIR